MNTNLQFPQCQGFPKYIVAHQPQLAEIKKKTIFQ